jgi:hypothetical protein
MTNQVSETNELLRLTQMPFMHTNGQSTIRNVVESVMIAAGLNNHDFRLRDKLIAAGAHWIDLQAQSAADELTRLQAVEANCIGYIDEIKFAAKQLDRVNETPGPIGLRTSVVVNELAKAREENAELKEAVFALRSLRGPDGHLLPSEVMETGLRMREPTHEEVAHLNNCASCRLRFDIYRSSVPPKDGKYPNLEAIAQGCISGAFREWPMVRPEVVGLFAELSELRAENARLAERVRVLEEAASAYLHRPAPAMNHKEALLSSELRSRLEQALTTDTKGTGDE